MERQKKKMYTEVEVNKGLSPRKKKECQIEFCPFSSFFF